MEGSSCWAPDVWFPFQKAADAPAGSEQEQYQAIVGVGPLHIPLHCLLVWRFQRVRESLACTRCVDGAVDRLKAAHPRGHPHHLLTGALHSRLFTAEKGLCSAFGRCAIP